jgi:hypothetical protein
MTSEPNIQEGTHFPPPRCIKSYNLINIYILLPQGLRPLYIGEVVGCQPFLREDLLITGTPREPSDHL